MKSRLRWAAAVLFVVVSSVSTLIHAAAISGQGTWETTLQGRDLDGNLTTAEAYYDTTLNITWLANAYYAGTAMNWVTANAWAAGLNPYGSGITGWRLPTVTDTSAPGCDYSYAGGTDCGYNVNTVTGEMANMYYVTLGNKAYCDPSTSTASTCSGFQPGWGLTNTGHFSNVQADYYWSATEYAPGTSSAWAFDFVGGAQDYGTKTYGLYAWAVHSGDVGASTVPVPAAAWLFGSGLIGLIGVARRKARSA